MPSTSTSGVLTKKLELQQNTVKKLTILSKISLPLSCKSKIKRCVTFVKGIKMASSQDFVTLGDLFTRDRDVEDEELLSKVKIIIEESLPPGWRDWKVVDWSKEELLGKKIDHRVLNKIRFAIPSVKLVQAFFPEAKSIGEKSYKNMKIKLLEWDIGRALITNPNHIAAKLRGSSTQAEMFNRAVEPIRASVYSREQISDALSTDVESHQNRVVRKDLAKARPSPNRSRSASLASDSVKRRRCSASSSSSYSPRREHTDSRLDRMEGMIQNLYEMMSANKENEEESQAMSWRAPSPGLVLPSVPASTEKNNNWDIFAPATKEAEPSIPRAEPVLEQQGIMCQRLGEPTWNKIRYADSQKKLQASPVFSCLRINATLFQHSQPSQLKDLLGKCDSAFGAITHGLLGQRQKLQEALKKVADEHPEATDSLRKLLASDSDFRSISDDLLQFACGKRAEIIESRRKLYEPRNNYYRSVLSQIPPSSTHLWDEEKLQDAIKIHGVTKIAPPPRRHLPDKDIKKQPRDHLCKTKTTSKYKKI
ncbi:hypothetical protein evm_002362 [Chilo suppressalis]|nr:hypothetical protein evm_002362 [Chilo suppressalis]